MWESGVMGISCPVGLDESGTGLPPRKPSTGGRSRARRVLRLLEALLLGTGTALLAVYAAAQVDAARSRAEALAAFSVARAEQAAATAEPAASTSRASLEYSDPDQSLWAKARVAAYRDSTPLVRNAPLAVLTIPAVELEAPIFEGTGELTLNRGIGRIDGTAEIGAAGNLGLAGHRDGYFRVLKDVHVGDAIDVESLSGMTRYRVTELEIVEPTDVHVLAPTETATLTLVTCYPFYFIGEAPQRYIVKGVAEDLAAGDGR
jgi:sortase A